jgi:hypothetical protein
MRRRLPLLICAALALAGCAQATTKNEPDAPSTATETAKKEKAKSKAKAEKTAAPKPKKAGIGDSITLTGFDGGKIKVKLLRVLDPVAGGDYEQPAAGKRYLGIELQLANVGDKTYKDSPSNGATVIYGDDRQASATLLIDGVCASNGFASDARISPGAKRKGCIPFEISTSRKPKTFQFALDSGFADEGGEWVLR